MFWCNEEDDDDARIQFIAGGGAESPPPLQTPREACLAAVVDRASEHAG
jgi:hypothetical protein